MCTLKRAAVLTLLIVYGVNAFPIKYTFKYLEDFESKAVLCPEDIRLYSPTNLKLGCKEAALNCVLLELNVLEHECEMTNDASFENLKYELSVLPHNSSPNCSCEEHAETNTKTFVQNIKQLLQRFNSNETSN